MLTTPTRFCGLLGSPEPLGADGRVGDFRQHVIAFDQFAERGVLTVEKRGVAVADEKLAAGGIGVRTARHGNDAPLVRAVVELGLDL